MHPIHHAFFLIELLWKRSPHHSTLFVCDWKGFHWPNTKGLYSVGGLMLRPNSTQVSTRINTWVWRVGKKKTKGGKNKTKHTVVWKSSTIKFLYPWRCASVSKMRNVLQRCMCFDLTPTHNGGRQPRGRNLNLVSSFSQLLRSRLSTVSGVQSLKRDSSLKMENSTIFCWPGCRWEALVTSSKPQNNSSVSWWEKNSTHWKSFMAKKIK